MKINVLTLFLFLLVIRVFTIGLDSKLIGYSLVGILLSGLFVYSIIKVRKLESFVSNKLSINIVLLLLVCSVSTFVAVYNGLPIKESLTALSKLLIVFFLLYFSYLCGRSIKSLLYLKVVIWCLFVHVLLGVILMPFGVVDEVHGASRLIGISGGVQVFSNLAMLLFLYSALSLILKESTVFPKHTLLSFLVIALTAMVLSNTLKNFGAALITLSLLFIVDFRKVIKWVPPMAILLIIAAPFIFDWFIESEVYERLVVVWEAGIKTTLEPGEKLESSLVWRFIHWSKLFNDWSQNYIYTGAGFGQITNMSGLKTPDGRGYEAHSDIVTIILEFGLLLSIPVFVLLFKLFSRTLSLYLSSHQKLFKVFFLCGVSLVIASSFGNVFYSLACMYFFWFFVGWSEGYARKVNES